MFGSYERSYSTIVIQQRGVIACPTMRVVSRWPPRAGAMYVFFLPKVWGECYPLGNLPKAPHPHPSAFLGTLKICPGEKPNVTIT